MGGMGVLFWAIMIFVFVALEIATVQLVSVWLAAGSLVTMLAVYYKNDLSVTAQLGIFIVVSSVLLLISFPLIRRRQKHGHVATNAELDVGKSAEVIEEINKDKNTGRVALSGVNWSAVTDTDEVIPVGTIVTILEVKGSKLVVKRK